MALKDKGKAGDEITSEEVLLSMVMQLRDENRQLTNELSSIHVLLRTLRAEADARLLLKPAVEG